MDDLLREIKKLSARVKESDSVSEETTSQPTSAKKTAKKRQKNTHKKHRGRKRQLKYIPADVEVDSSSFTDCTDEDIIRDYIENITANLSDSDVESKLGRGAFLVTRDLTSTHDFLAPWSPEVDETDSFSESLRFTQAKKKRRRYKRHNIDSLEPPMEHVNDVQRNRIHNALANHYSRSLKSHSHKKKLKLESTNEEDGDESMDVVNTQDSSQANSSSDNSDSSSNSPGSEADDEGEESCFEAPSSAIKPVIPWWEDQNMYSCDESSKIEDNKIEQSLSLIQRNRAGFQTRLVKSSGPVLLCESGGFVAYANHKIKNFVLHRDSNELSLYTANKKEQSQLAQLAALYNLQSTVEDAVRSSKVVLTKTITTEEPNQGALKSFLSKEVKLRCRKNRPRPQWNSKRRKIASMSENTAYSSELMDVPLPDTNVGNQMLRTMGWKPGQGLGKDNGGITNPVKPTRRPRNLGFGHPAGPS